MASNTQQQQSSSSPLIWFLLLDSATGQPYKGTSAEKVSASSSAEVIAQFRKALKGKNPNKISSVDAADLLVYKNKAAFDKRNADDGKEDPLEEDSLVDSLGTSKKEALIVVVPSSILPSQPSSFPLCKVQFYNDIYNATERDGWRLNRIFLPPL